MHKFITVEGSGRGWSNAFITGEGVDVGTEIFHRSLCLPSDIKMTTEQQDLAIEMIKRCFGRENEIVKERKEKAHERLKGMYE